MPSEVLIEPHCTLLIRTRQELHAVGTRCCDGFDEGRYQGAADTVTGRAHVNGDVREDGDGVGSGLGHLEFPALPHAARDRPQVPPKPRPQKFPSQDRPHEQRQSADERERHPVPS